MQDPGSNSRYEILKLLKKRKLRISEISEILDMSQTAIRQHMAILEGNGLVEKSSLKEGMGRPKFYYFLSEKAEVFFPKAYVKLIEWIVEDIIKTKGVDELRDILIRLGKEQSVKYKIRFGSNSVYEDVRTLVEVLKERDMVVEIDENHDSVIIKQYNCLFYNISKKFGRTICEFDHSFIDALIEKEIEVLTCIANGDRYCSFRISF